jgi:hypothetical protein
VTGARVTPGHVVLVAVCVVWAAGLALILRHAIFVTNDSVSNYIHVWYVAHRLWGGHGVPLHMPVLGHGDAFAFPYGFIPWFSAALLRPLFGDWIVTLWLVLGLLLLIAGQWWAFPELRGSWWMSLLLLNPMLIEGPLLGQLPFLWAVAMTFAAIALWRRERMIAAAVLLGLAQATHPAVMLPIVGPIVLLRLYWEPRRLHLLAAYAASLLIAAPAAWIVLASPSVSDSSTKALLGNFFGTVSLRALVVGAPFIVLVLQRTPLARVPLLLAAFFVALNVALVPIRKDQFAWTALARSPDESLLAYIDSPAFHPGATYRILRVGDGKIGMYQLVRGGARLDSEPFPESIDRRSWADEASYAAFLRERNVEYIIIYRTYDRRYLTNEHALLDAMASPPAAAGTPCAERVVSTDTFDVYAMRAAPC